MSEPSQPPGGSGKAFGADPVWTEEELDILKTYFPVEGLAVLDRLPNQFKGSVRMKAGELGLLKHHGHLDEWTEPEDAILRAYYPSEGGDVSYRLPLRSRSACLNRAERLGLVLDEYRAWSEEEDALLRRDFLREGPAAMAERLVCRTELSVARHAVELGLCGAEEVALGAVPNQSIWTPDEERILAEFWPVEGIAAAERLPKHSPAACRNRARKLGLSTPRRTDSGRELVRTWSREELTILRKYYSLEPLESVLKRLPGRSRESVYNKARRLDLVRFSPWTQLEDEILLLHFPQERAQVAQRLPGRSEHACCLRAKHLGIRPQRMNGWTDEEIERLRRWYPTMAGDVSQMLPGRSRSACIAKAKELRLHRMSEAQRRREQQMR